MNDLRDVGERLKEMIADPFGGAMLRSQVPPDRGITVALADETIHDVVYRAVRSCDGTPAYVAVGEPDRDELTLFIIERGDDGRFVLRRPGDWLAATKTLTQDDAIGRLIEELRDVHQAAPNPPEQ